MGKLCVIAVFLVLGICIIFAGTTQQTTEGTLTTERVNPGGIVTLNCTVPSLSHWWNVSSRDGGRSLTRADQDSVIQDPPFNFSVADAIPGSSITSTAVATVPVELNGTIVSCRDGFWVLPDPQSWVILVTVTGTQDPITTVSTDTEDREDGVPFPVTLTVNLESGNGSAVANGTMSVLLLLLQVSSNISNQTNLQFCSQAWYSAGGEDITTIRCTCSSEYHQDNLHQNLIVHLNCPLHPSSIVDVCNHNLTVQVSIADERGSSNLSNPVMFPVDCPKMESPPPPDWGHLDLGKVIGIAVGVVLTVVALFTALTVLTLCCMYRKRVRQRKPDEELALSRMGQPTETNAHPQNMQDTNSEATTPLLVESSSTCENDLSQDPTSSSTCTSSELLPHVQQQPVEEEETDKNEVAREDSSAKNDGLSQDPTPSSTCASPELPPHVQQQPVEEEEIDKNEVAREDSSAKNDDLSQDPTPSCASPELPPHVPMEKEKTGDSMDEEKDCSVADSPPQRSDSPPKLPSHVRPETSKEERLTKDSPAESDDPSEDPCASPKLPPHVQWQPIEEEETATLPLPVMESGSDVPPQKYSTPVKQMEEIIDAFIEEQGIPVTEAMLRHSRALSGHQTESGNDLSRVINREDDQVIAKEDGYQLSHGSEYVNRSSAKRTQRHQALERNEGMNVIASQEGGNASDPYSFPSLGEDVPIGPQLSSPKPQVAVWDLPITSEGIWKSRK